jgi:hypothetical protein
VHKPVEEAQEGQPIMVRVKMPVLKGVVVELHHRRKGEADYTAEVMKRAGADKVARIAAEDVTGTALQYYIEAKDPRGDVVKRFGSATEPFIVLIER